MEGPLALRAFFEEFIRRVHSFNVVADSIEEMPNAFVYGIKSATIELIGA